MELAVRLFETLLVFPDGEVYIILGLNFSPYATGMDMLPKEKRSFSFPVYLKEHNYILSMKRK